MVAGMMLHSRSIHNCDEEHDVEVKHGDDPAAGVRSDRKKSH